MAKLWYVVHVYSNMEKNVQQALEERIERSGLKDRFGRILVPSEEVEDRNKNGQRKVTERRIFPGYIFIEMELDDETWHLVRSTNRVTGFLGGANRPTPISQREVDRILAQMEQGGEKPRPKVLFEVGETLRVKEGPFADFNGTVEDVSYEKNKLKMTVTIFGRATPIELDFNQVEKL